MKREYSKQTHSKQPQVVNVTFRKLDFGLDDTVPRYWVRDNPFITHFYHAYSVMLVDGEKFLIDSVRNFKDDIDDQDTLDEISAFCRQEAHHTHQHNLLNAIIEERGVNVPFYVKIVKRALGIGRLFGKKQQLAVTCALEHLTACNSHEGFSNSNVHEGMEKRMSQLWLWHQMEEIEHKAVCFDLYNRVGGSYLTRVFFFTLVNLFFWPLVFLLTFHMLWADKQIGNIRQYWPGISYLFSPRKGCLARIIPDVLSYYKPSFHPWDVNDAEFIEQWVNANGDMVLN